MQCPKCKEGVIFTPKYGASGNNDLEESICGHCDGSGEINKGDVWKCQSIHDGFYCYMYYCNPGWRYNDFGLMPIDENKVKPISRMKEVT